MRLDVTLRWVVLACAIFLLLAAVAPRTSWERGSRNRATVMYDTAGYNIVGLTAGATALAALGIGSLWPRREVAAGVVAATAFAAAAYLIGIYALALARGEALLMGRDEVTAGWVLHPTPAPRYFAVAALAGAVAALALAAVRWKRREGE